MSAGYLDEIARLDPRRDHVRIVRRMACHEFPWDMTRALELALFRTYCVPSISALLDRTGEFARCPQKRYDDTDLIVSTLMEEGYDSPAGQAALARMNAIHGRFRIGNPDFLYVLSTFVFVPLNWIEGFGRRPPHPHERLALFHFWRAVGERMGIRDIPADYESFAAYHRDYEATRHVFRESNRRIGEATRELFASWFPSPLRPLPVRRQPRLRTRLRHRSYPRGWTLDDLGPAWIAGRSTRQFHDDKSGGHHEHRELL